MQKKKCWRNQRVCVQKLNRWASNCQQIGCTKTCWDLCHDMQYKYQHTVNGSNPKFHDTQTTISSFHLLSHRTQFLFCTHTSHTNPAGVTDASPCRSVCPFGVVFRSSCWRPFSAALRRSLRWTCHCQNTPSQQSTTHGYACVSDLNSSNRGVCVYY